MQPIIESVNESFVKSLSADNFAQFECEFDSLVVNIVLVFDVSIKQEACAFKGEIASFDAIMNILQQIHLADRKDYRLSLLVIMFIKVK